jgi:hypothetical protein
VPIIAPAPVCASVITVGQDRAGHWLVQESSGAMEGRFVSFAAAMAFARGERHGFPGATISVATRPLVPAIPFKPVGNDERADARTAA